MNTAKQKDRDKINLDLMRTFSLYAGPVVILYRFIFLYSDPDAVDPLWMRFSIAGLFATFSVGCYYFPTAIKKYATALFSSIQYATTCWLAYLAYLNNLSSSVTLGFIVVIVTIYFVFHTKRALAVYASVVTGLAVLVTFTAPEPQIVPLFFLSTIIVIAFFTYIILHSRLDAMDELDKSEAIMGTVFHDSGDAFLVIDAEEETVISHNNTVFETLEVRTVDQLLSKLATMLTNSEASLEPQPALRALISSTPLSERIQLNPEDDGRWIDVHIKELDSSNNRLLLVKVSDITQGKRIDEYRIAKEAAEEANRLKDSFLATMSHELRTPMNGVIGMANLLNYTQLDEEQSDYVQTIHTSSENLMSILNDILDFTRLGSGLAQLDIQPFSPVLVMEEVAELFAMEAGSKKIELVVHPDAAGYWEVEGDSKLLWKVLMNVVGNAVKFTPTGEICINLETKRLQNDTLELHFSVQDTGIGIPSHALETIFEHFKQVDASFSRSYEGIGLGLAITRQLVELLGGEIWAESLLGKGSTFHWKIPVGLPATANHPEDPAQTAYSVLLLDHRPASIRRMEQLFNRKGDTCYSTNDPSEVYARLENGHMFDLAMIDIFLPGQDAFELARALKKKASNALRVILLAPMGVKTEFSADVADALLTKPILEDAFYKRIESVMAPINQPALQRLLNKRKRAAALPHKREVSVLLVEDNIMNQQVALSTLGVLGYRADVADNGQHALEQMAKKSYDLIFMDLQMPLMDGLEATRQIRTTYIEKPPYIIALTANALASDYEQCMAVGMNDFLSKPINIKELKAKLDDFDTHLVAALPNPNE
ncbi:MAG: response regulator [Bacteroidota bacterium]